MHIHEFELRYRAYKWLNHKFDLWWNQEIILEMTKISNQGTLTKPVQEIKPEELHEITLETYTTYKKGFSTNKYRYTTDTYRKPNLILNIGRIYWTFRIWTQSN